MDVEKNENINSDTAVIILLIDNPAFKTKKPSYKQKLFGKSMVDWIEFAVGDLSIKHVKASLTDDIVNLVKPHLTDKKYTAVFYSDTPLLQQKTFLEIMEYIKVKRLSVVKLTRGYVFETDYIKTLDTMYSPQQAYFEEEDFIAAYNLKQLGMINDILKMRILNFHLKNGVKIVDTASTYIDADVTIESNVVIEPNNFIKGKTTIEEGVHLKEFNVIKDSFILKDAKVERSTVKDSVIGKECEVGPFAYIHNESIMEQQSEVGSFVELKRGKLERRAKVKRLSFVGKE